MSTSQIATTAGVISFLVALNVLYITILLIIRYKTKPQKATLYIIVGNLSWVCGALSAAVIYFFSGTSIEIGALFQILMYTFVFSATIFTYMFARKIFFTEKTKFYIFYVLIGIVAILILAFSNSSYIEPFPDSVDFPAMILKTEYSLILVVYLIPTIIGIVVSAFKTARKMEERIYAAGFRLIGVGQIFILCIFICDTIATFLITDIVGYAVFLYLQWIFAALASFALYIGWTIPPWFKKIYGVAALS